MKKPWKCLPLAIPFVVALGACSDGEIVEPAPTPNLDPAQLAPPPAGQGFQLTTGEFDVPAGAEAQDCYFFRIRELAKQAGLPENDPVNLHRIQLVQRDGSHHMNIFRVKTIGGLDPANGAIQHGLNGQGECFKSPNWADWPLVANTQQDGEVDWTYPEGVANVFQPDEWIMLQTHYVNASTQATPDKGFVKANFWTIPASEVKHQLGTLFATKQSIRVCESNPNPTFEGGCQFNSPAPVNIIGANGHFHSRGTRFDMYAWDGTTLSTPDEAQRFYSSQSWDDPPMLISPELELSVPANAGVWYSCTYEWTSPEPAVGCQGLDKFDSEKYMTAPEDLDCCYTFGPIVEKNEHCNIFVYYYPKVDDINCQ